MTDVGGADVSGEHVMWSPIFPGASRQTLTLESADALLGVIDRARREGPKVLVLTGGETGWCFGGDLEAFADAHDRPAYIDELASKLHAAVIGLHQLDAIVITVVTGFAAGAGMPLAAAGDIVLASDSAKFTLGYTKIGLTPDGGTSLLAATLGTHRLLYAALVNPVITAAAAHGYGLVGEVLPAAQLLERAAELAGILAAGAASALASTKHLIRQRALPNTVEALAAEQARLVRAAGHHNATEGITAFLSKQAPTFT